MENINSPESLKAFKELLSSNNPVLKPEFIQSITNVQAVLKRYYQPTYLIVNKDIEYTDNFIDYIIEGGLKKSSKFDFDELFKSIISVYMPQLRDLLTDSNVSYVYEHKANKSEPLEIDFDFDNGIVVKHRGETIKTEFSDISLIETRIKEIRQVQKLQEDMKISSNIMKQLPRLKSIIK